MRSAQLQLKLLTRSQYSRQIDGLQKPEMCVDSAVITKCFRKAGILGDFNVVLTSVVRDDPFHDLYPQSEEDQSDPELLSLMRQTHDDKHCSFDTFVYDTDSIATCLDMDNEQWQKHSLQSSVPL